MKWPTDQWSLLLQSVLKGKVQEAYTALPISECVDYNCVKNAILKAYELVPEAYRQKIRNYCKQESQTHDDIKIYLDEQKVENLAQTAAHADDYALTHKSTSNKSRSFGST